MTGRGAAQVRRDHDVVIPLLGFNPSGGVRMVIHVANALSARGVSVAFGAPRHAAAPPLELHAGIDVIVRGSARGLRDRLDFARRLPRARVYVATGYQTPLLIAAGMILRARRGRIFHLIQNDEPTSHVTYGGQPAWSKPILRALARSGYRVPATRVAVSRFVAERVGPGRIHRVIPPGTGPEFIERAAAPAAAPPRGARISVGVLAHPAPVKGMATALAAFAARRDDRRFRFIAFDGDHPAPLPDFVARFSGLAAAEGRRHEVAEFLSSCDVFVFPSLVEGFGLPPLEAMACGAAVVVTDCGGVREYARDGHNCLLVEPGDPAAVGAALDRLAQDASLRTSLVRAGRETAAQFSAERFAAQCADEIQRLIEATH